MISSQRLLKMARKWQKFTENARRRISTSRIRKSSEAELCIKSLPAKGHFVAYTIDGKRFMVPLAYLNNPIFIELFRMSEDQFGLPYDGPITMPCDGLFMEYVASFIQRRLSEDVEKALLTSIAMERCSTPSMLQLEQNHQQILMARKWQKFAVNARRRISASRSGRSVETESCIKSVADEGHFVVYSTDGRRFMVPLDYLSSPIFVELLRMSEDQFGLPRDGPITIPCEAIFMEYVISFLKRKLSKEVGTSLLTSMAAGRCSTPSMLQAQNHQQILVHRLLKMARKWRKFTENARRRISTTRTRKSSEAESCIKSVASKGHFVAYTIDGKRFMVPLACLNSPIFIELFRMSEDQFGLPCDGPITMPCDGLFMEYVSFGRRGIARSRNRGSIESETCTKSVADKGHLFVNTVDGKHFMVPLAYLNSLIFIELFKLSENQFGLACDGPITLPCDAVFMEFVLSFIQRCLSKDIEKALLNSIATGRCSTPSMLQQGQIHQ
ncbi:Auxin-responsive protein SAUR36 [Cinnamomum micranthum f. kanehirae]|uniref:Auxin-responsive protein SAUR36 n=1 Tax=Cinnamomum micranthum f. kanehirae TaxID=337451 RepID=A0A443PIN5_9MAGN|nr:Auxin-responsive protein SAUR36 [Cinnamomum micranthum f. kanehirae]